MSRWRVPVRWVLPVLAVALVAATWWAPEPEPQKVDGGSSAVPVEQTTWACPVQSGWTVSAGQVKAGVDAVASAIPEAAVDPVWAAADRWRSAPPSGDALLLQQRGEGSGSVGFVAGGATKAQGGGEVLGSCPAIVDDAWFVGLGDAGRTASTVTLVNLGETRAIADLTWWGAAGPIQSSDTTGIVVEAGQRRVVPVEAVAAGEGAVALHVSRRQGALTAVALDAGRGGADLVAPTASAAKDQVLAGLPDGTGTRLRLVNPGTSTAHVSVDVLGPDGAFGAKGLDDVAIDPETTKVVAVPGSVDVRRSSLHLSSDVDVVASALVSGDDVAHVVAATALTGPAVVPVALGGSPVGTTITAANGPATVAVESFAADMTSLGSSDLTVPANSSVTAPAPAKGASYVVLTPADGSTVWAGMWQRDGKRLAAAPVRPAPVSVVAPGVSVR